MKTQYYAASTLDGFLATEEDSLDWLFPLAKMEETSYPSFIKDVGAIAMGSATYQFLLDQLAAGKTDAERTWPYSQPTWVFTSRQLPIPPKANVKLCRGSVKTIHEEMRAESSEKNIWIVGGGELVGKFYDAGLVDELIIQIGSVTLGAGKPLLPRTILFPKLQLTSIEKVNAGMAELRYRIQK